MAKNSFRTVFGGQNFDAGGVFAGRHARNLFEMAGEIVDGVIAQQRGNLGEIVRALPDHALPAPGRTGIYGEKSGSKGYPLRRPGAR